MDVDAEPLLRTWVIRDMRDALLLAHPQHAGLVRGELRAALDRGDESWLPARLFYDLLADFHAAAGSAAVIDLCRRSSWMANASPLAKALVWQLLKLIRNNPERIFAWLPALQKRSTRGLGSLRFEDRGSGCRLICMGVPPSIATPAYVAAWTGTCLGLLDFIRARGDVKGVATADGTVIDIGWTQSARGRAA